MAKGRTEIAKEFLRKYEEIDQLNQQVKQRFMLSDEDQVTLVASIIDANDSLTLIAELFERAAESQ